MSLPPPIQPAQLRTYEAVLSAFLPPLALVGALPAQYASYAAQAPPSAAVQTWWADGQRVLMSEVCVSWQATLEQRGIWTWLWRAWFCPDTGEDGVCATIWRNALAVCTEQLSAAAHPDVTLHTATRALLCEVVTCLLTQADPVARLLDGVATAPRQAARDLLWSDGVAALTALPTRTLNAFEHEAPGGDPATFLARLGAGVERGLATRPQTAPQLAQLLSKLVRTGFVSAPPLDGVGPTARASFWGSVLPAALAKVQGTARHPFAADYTAAWHALAVHMSAPDVQAVALSLACFLDRQGLEQTHRAFPITAQERAAPGTEGRAFLAPEARTAAVAVAALLDTLSGRAGASDESPEPLSPRELVQADAAHIGQIGTPLRAVAYALWFGKSAGARSSIVPDMLALWGDATRTYRASAAQETSLVALILVGIATVPPSARAEVLTPMAHSPAFLQGVSAHLDHSDAVVRRLGMLLAEVVSALTVPPGTKPLQFPRSVWDGRGDGRELCRVLRALYVTIDPAALWEEPATCAHWTACLGGAAWTRGDDASHGTGAAAVTERPSRPPPASTRLPVRVAPRAARRPLIEVMDEDTDGTALSKPTAAASRGDAPPPPFLTYAPPETHDDSSDDAPSSDEDTGDVQGLVEDISGAKMDEVAGDNDAPVVDAALAKRRRPPVYIGDLAPLFREHDRRANKTGLRHAEALVRRKTGWGNEIADNATDLCLALCALQDTYSLHDFAHRRTGALAALAVACPDPVVDVLAEHVFLPHYAVAQRLSMLRAIAFAAHELADGAPAMAAAGELRAMHGDVLAREARALGDAASAQMRAAGEQRIAALPAAQRAAKLRVGEAMRRPLPFAPPGSVRARPSYIVAAPVFLYPLLRRLWAYLQKPHETSTQYRGAGTEPVLTPAVLAAILHTLAVLCYHARSAPVLRQTGTDEVLELVDLVLVGIAPHIDERAHFAVDGGHGDDAGTTLSEAALTLALVVLDGAKERDGGRALVQANSALLLRVQAAAEALFARAESGAVRGGSTAEAGPSASIHALVQRRAAAVVVAISTCGGGG
ncbi:telomere binding protein [Malassezia sp. CBS 17886]|nr:telomere binding protein [Malassezia sp. CBS 17886]